MTYQVGVHFKALKEGIFVTPTDSRCTQVGSSVKVLYLLLVIGKVECLVPRGVVGVLDGLSPSDLLPLATLLLVNDAHGV